MERLPFHQLHNDEEHPICVTKVVDSDEIRMIEPCHGFGFGLETGPELGVGAELAGQDLDGDCPVEGDLTGGIDCAHATLRDETGDLVCGEEGLQLLDAGRIEFKIVGGIHVDINTQLCPSLRNEASARTLALK